MKFSDPEFRRFLVAGVCNTAVGYGLYLLFNLFTDYRTAYSLSYVGGALFSYVLNSVYVFRKPLGWSRLLAYPSVYLIQYLAGLALIWLLVGQCSMPERYAPLIIVPVTIPLTFLVSRFIVKGRQRVQS